MDTVEDLSLDGRVVAVEGVCCEDNDGRDRVMRGEGWDAVAVTVNKVVGYQGSKQSLTVVGEDGVQSAFVGPRAWLQVRS